MCFEETIFCDKVGNVHDQGQEMAIYICPHCGTANAFASFADKDECICIECGEIGLPTTEVE